MRRGKRNQRGVALALVVVAGAALTAAWSAADSRTVALVRIREALHHRELVMAEQARKRLAMAQALALLETGWPPLSGANLVYACESIISTNEVDEASYILRYEKQDETHWTVTVRPRSEADPLGLPQPTRFPAK